MTQNKQDITVMVVEDEEMLLKAVTKKFKESGIKVVSCLSGTQALDYIEEFSSTGEIPNVIWMDYYLKEMDGLELISKLKRVVDIDKLPIVVVSNSASEEKVNSMLALGVDKYFLKAQYRLDNLVEEVIKLAKEGSLD